MHSLDTATGLRTVISENEQAYITAILAAADGALDTPEEIAAMVAHVNQSLIQ